MSIQAIGQSNANSWLAQILASHTGQPIDRIAKDTDRDRYLSAAEAKEYGIVDEIFTSLKDMQ